MAKTSTKTTSTSERKPCTAEREAAGQSHHYDIVAASTGGGISEGICRYCNHARTFTGGIDPLTQKTGFNDGLWQQRKTREGEG